MYFTNEAMVLTEASSSSWEVSMHKYRWKIMENNSYSVSSCSCLF